jgi:hypothetical protein
MKKLITSLLLGAGLGLGAFQAAADDVQLRNGTVEVIALSAGQVARIQTERAMFTEAVSLLMAMDDRASQQRLEEIRGEHERRIERIVNNEEVPSHPRQRVQPMGVIY